MNPSKNKIVVLGGAGSMGKIVVRDLIQFAPSNYEIVIADYDMTKAQTLSRDWEKYRKTVPLFCDVKKQDVAVKALQGTEVLINCVQYQWNVEVMQLALLLDSHYVDLGGLFHITRKQLELDGLFKKIQKTALLGMGAAPGITNVLARLCCDEMDSVKEIQTSVASKDLSKYSWKPALMVSYSLQTILEEFSMAPAVFEKGHFKMVEPMSGRDKQTFPKPIGTCRPMYTLHSEVATLPLSFADKGVTDVSFKIAFDEEFIQKVQFLKGIGFSSHVPVRVGEAVVSPIEVINKIAMAQEPAQVKGKPRAYEIIRTRVVGKKKGKRVTMTADCHCTGMPAWNMGTDIDTGCPASIGALMLLDGRIGLRGAVPPELAVPVQPFLAELKKRKMIVKVAKG